MSGTKRMVLGAVPGTGASIDIRTVGFRPCRVELINVAAGGLATSVWQEGMADGSAFKRVAAGTATFPTTLGITPLSDGFRIGADTDMNVSGERIHWVAYGPANGE